MRAAKTEDSKLLALRLEARWNDARAAYDRLKLAEAAAKADLKERKEAIDAIEAAIASVLREEHHEDPRVAFSQIQKLRVKADKRAISMDNASKRHKTEITKRRTALEQLLGSDLSQLPLLLPDMSVVTDLHVDGLLLLVGDPIHLKGIEQVLYVKGFRTEGDANNRQEVVVVEDDEGETIDTSAKDLSRPKGKTKGKNGPRLPPKTKAAAKAAEDEGAANGAPKRDHGGLEPGDEVSHRTTGDVGLVVGFSTNSSRVLVVSDGTDKTPKEVGPDTLDILKKKARKVRRIGFKLGDEVATESDKRGKIVEITTRETVAATGGTKRSFPGLVKVLLEGGRTPKKFHSSSLKRHKKPAK